MNIMERVLTKRIGRALLQYYELEDVLLVVEYFLKNRPLCYAREEFDRPDLTPNILLHSWPAGYVEEDTEEADIKCVQEKWGI